MTAPDLVSVSELARLKGVRKSAISQRLKRLEAEGLISSAVDGQRKVVSLAAWDRVTEETSDTRRGRGPTPAGRDAPAAPSAGAVLTQARTETEQLRAQMARLEYQRRTGQLLPREEVTAAMAACAAAIVREIDQMAGRADDVAAAVQRGGVVGAREFLKSHARMMRDALTRRMVLLSGDNDGAESK